MKLAINLLPQEFKIEELKRAKFYRTQTIGVVIILLTSFIASITVALRILQSQNITQIQANLSKEQQRVSGLKNTQGSLLLLKNRLATVNKYLEVPSEGVSIYKLVNQLLPASVAVNSISIGKSGEILILATATDATAIEQLFSNLISAETNQNKVKEISMDNLSRGRDGLYRLSFTVKPK